MTTLMMATTRLQLALRTRVRTGSERGDVPGWVLVTLMTAGIVAVLWTLAGDRLELLFNQALDKVDGR